MIHVRLATARKSLACEASYTRSEGERGENTDGLVVSDEDVAGSTGSDSGGDEGGTGMKGGQG